MTGSSQKRYYPRLQVVLRTEGRPADKVVQHTPRAIGYSAQNKSLDPGVSLPRISGDRKIANAFVVALGASLSSVSTPPFRPVPPPYLCPQFPSSSNLHCKLTSHLPPLFYSVPLWTSHSRTPPSLPSTFPGRHPYTDPVGSSFGPVTPTRFLLFRFLLPSWVSLPSESVPVFNSQRIIPSLVPCTVVFLPRSPVAQLGQTED